jgi:hypothetical protein
MKRIIFVGLLLFTSTFLSFSVAQVSENFNTRPGASAAGDIKPFLQNSCWVLSGGDINLGGWDAGIEGDGALVSSLGAGEQAGIYTPMVQVPGNLYISFNYRFNINVPAGHDLRLSLTNFDNSIYMELDNVDMSGKNANTTYNYTSYFNNLPSGAYRVFINFRDPDQTTQIAIDQFYINIPTLYPSGCNNAPVASHDVVTGLDNYTASGTVFGNDYDANGEYFIPYLITNSADGNVILNADGSFTFTPNAGFSGTATSFTYQVCDNGFAPLCSDPAVVTINFPSASLPAKLVDFSASIDDDRKVNIRWTTTFEVETDRFEVERSLDGIEFKKIGEVKTAGNSQIRKDYAYDDRLSTSTLNKKDVFYRLRLVNLDNRSELSKVLVIRLVNTSSTKTIAVTPNPAKNDINVQVQLRENSYVVMKVTNSNGDEVARKSTRGGTGLNSFSIEGTSRLAPGVYILEVIVNSSERMITRLIKN